jgi:NADH:ubiquinone oxidoreductase subunit C
MSAQNQNQMMSYVLTSSALVQIRSQMPALIAGTAVTPLATTLRTSPRNLRPLTIFLKNSTQIQAASLTDICVTDRLKVKGRFVVKYFFISLKLNTRLSLTFCVNETSTIPSLAAPFFNNQRIFASAG